MSVPKRSKSHRRRHRRTVAAIATLYALGGARPAADALRATGLAGTRCPRCAGSGEDPVQREKRAPVWGVVLGVLKQIAYSAPDPCVLCNGVRTVSADRLGWIAEEEEDNDDDT